MGMAYLIEPTPDLGGSWLTAQREHTEIDGHAEATYTASSLADVEDALGWYRLCQRCVNRRENRV